MDTLAALANSKAVFADRSERDVLASKLDLILAKDKPLYWLEVGVGDGANLRFLLDTLGHRRQFAVTAIDPSPLAIKQINTHKIEILHVGVETFVPDKYYDCINARQSAYYFGNPASDVLSLAGWLTPDGLLAVTIWSEDCILYRLNRAIARAAGCNEAGLRAEDLIKSLPSGEFVVERYREPCGRIDMGRLREDRNVFAAVCSLAARKINISALTERHLAELFFELERLETAHEKRWNELIFVRRLSPPISK
jgi:SAM-dependent methyltransferase